MTNDHPQTTGTHTLPLTATDTLDQHPALIYLASLSAGSRRTMFQALDTIARLLSGGELDLYTFDWGAVRYQHTAAVRAVLAERYKPATANKMLSALRQVLRHAWMLGQMSAEDYHRARAIETVKGQSLPAGRDLGLGEIAALMQVCEDDASPAGARDAAIIALMYATGIRRASVVRLDLADYDAQTTRYKSMSRRGARRTWRMWRRMAHSVR